MVILMLPYLWTSMGFICNAVFLKLRFLIMKEMPAFYTRLKKKIFLSFPNPEVKD